METTISLAPLEGITTAIYRRNIDKHFGGIDRFYTPFISADSSYNFRRREYEELEPYDSRLVPQLIANNPEYFIYGAKKLAEFGYEEVNLNMGCPSGTVVAKGKGSGMLSDMRALGDFFERIFEEKEMPKISVKTRIGMEDESVVPELAGLLAKYPFSQVIIHPRTRGDFYKGPLHMEAFREMAENIGWERITYNGDIRRPSDYERLREELPECESFMIGRGLITDPSLAREIKGGEGFSSSELLAFLDNIWEDYERRYGAEKQLLDKMKELWTYLGENYPDKKRALKELKKARRKADYRAALLEILA